MNLRERLRTTRGFLAYALHVPLHWLNLALLPYAGDWIYRQERREAAKNLSTSGALNSDTVVIKIEPE